MAVTRRGRYTRPMGLLLLLCLAVPVLDVYLLVRLGERVGAGPVLLLVIFSAVLGGSLAKREGLRVLRHWQERVAQRRVPEEGLASGLLVLVGGVLLMLPGLITDVLGLLCLAPPSRRWIARLLRGRLERAVREGRAQVSVSWGGTPSWPRPERPDDDVIEGEFEDHSRSPPHLPG